MRAAPDVMNDPILLRVEEVAALLRIGRRKAYELATSEAIPVLRIGRALRVPRDLLEEWVRKNARGGDVH